MNLRARLVLLVIAALVPVLALVAGLLTWISDAEDQAARLSLLAEAQNLAAALDRELAAGIRQLQTLAESPLLAAADLASFHRVATNVLRTSAPWQAIVLIAPSGQQLLNTFRPYGAPLPRSPIPDRALKAVWTSGRPEVTDLFDGPVLGRPVFALCVPVIRDGQVVAALAGVSAAPGLLAQLVDRRVLASERIAVIADGRQRIVARSHAIERYLGQPASAGFAAVARTGQEGVFRGDTLVGVSALGVVRPSALSGWAVGIGVPIAVVEAPGRQRLWVLALAAAGAIAVGVGLAFLTGLRIERPMRALTELASTLRRGEIPAGGGFSLPEAGEVARTLTETAAERRRTEDLLRGSEERFRRMANAAFEAIAIHDEGTILDVNPALCRLFGYDRDDVIGRSALELTAPESRALMAEMLRSRPTAAFEAVGLRKDGTTFIGEVRGREIEFGGRLVGVAAVRDISDLKRAEALSRGLTRAAQDLAPSLEAAVVGDRITAAAVTHLRTRASFLMRHVPAHELVEIVAARGPGDVARWIGRRFPLTRGISGAVLRSGRPYKSRDMLADPELPVSEAWREYATQHDCRAALGVPLMVRDDVIGVLTVGDAAGRDFSPDEITLLSAFASQAALALHNADLFAETEARRRQAEILADTARVLSRELSISTVAQAVVDRVRSLFGADLSGLRMPASDGSLELVAGSGVDFPAGHRIPSSAGLAGAAFSRRSAVVVEDYLDAPELSMGEGLRGEAMAMGIRGAAAVPLEVHDQLVGVLTVGFTQPRRLADAAVSVLQAFADQAAIAIHNAQLFERLSESTARLEALSRRLLEAQESTARDIARGLHDDIGQLLTAAKMTLEMIRQSPAQIDAGPRLGEAIALVDGILARVRDLSLTLRPSILDDLGLVPALRWYCARQAERAGLTLDLELETVGRPRPEVETACFRIVQEALTNVARHARASRVGVGLRRDREGLALTITDDGAGFDVITTRRDAAGGRSVGLLGMEERAQLLGGRLAIASTPGAGTTVSAWLPLASAPDGGTDA